MYAALADAYDLTERERHVLERLGVEADDPETGTSQWAVDRFGREAETWAAFDTLSIKLDAVNQPVTLQNFGLWYWRSACPLPILEQPDVLLCPKCRRTMGPALFPFWPLENRCADCIREQAKSEVRLIKQQMAGEKLRELLAANNSTHAAVPHITELVGGLITKLGGTQGLIDSWGAMIKELAKIDTATARAEVLKHYRALANMVADCNKMQQEELSMLDNLDDEQLRDYIAGLLVRRLTHQQIKMILEDVADVPQQLMGRVEYDGKA
jgi:hypothetical protein